MFEAIINNDLFIRIENPEDTTDEIYFVPEGVKRIFKEAFKDTKFSKIYLPDSLEEIGLSAFENCTHLEEIIFPKNLKLIDAKAFYGDKKLKTVKFNEGLKRINEDAFGFSGIEKIVFPDSLETIEREAFFSCQKLQKVFFSNKITDIADDTFAQCSSLESVVLPNLLETIGEFAFKNCHSLKNVVFTGNKLISIGHAAFTECSFLRKITLPDSTTVLGDYAFSECHNLKEIDLPKNLEFIGTYCFEATSINSLILPNTLNIISDEAFGGLYNDDCKIYASRELIESFPDLESAIGPAFAPLTLDALIDMKKSLKDINAFILDQSTSQEK